jgi:hypothetical protein
MPLRTGPNKKMSEEELERLLNVVFDEGPMAEDVVGPGSAETYFGDAKQFFKSMMGPTDEAGIREQFGLGPDDPLPTMGVAPSPTSIGKGVGKGIQYGKGVLNFLSKAAMPVFGADIVMGASTGKGLTQRAYDFWNSDEGNQPVSKNELISAISELQKVGDAQSQAMAAAQAGDYAKAMEAFQLGFAQPPGKETVERMVAELRMSFAQQRALAQRIAKAKMGAELAGPVLKKFMEERLNDPSGRNLDLISYMPADREVVAAAHAHLGIPFEEANLLPEDGE